MTKFGCPVEKREDLRNQIIAQYGEAFEILDAERPRKGQVKARKRKWKGKRQPDLVNTCIIPLRLISGTQH